ncbi:MAG: hypothetical protein ACUZ8H_10205 [Candidatus Anammoxibacter sp.]
MSNITKYCIIILLSMAFLGSTLNLVEGKPDDANDKPPGWSKGKKKWVKGNMPPGLAKEHRKKHNHNHSPESKNNNNHNHREKEDRRVGKGKKGEGDRTESGHDADNDKNKTKRDEEKEERA